MDVCVPLNMVRKGTAERPLHKKQERGIQITYMFYFTCEGVSLSGNYCGKKRIKHFVLCQRS